MPYDRYYFRQNHVELLALIRNATILKEAMQQLQERLQMNIMQQTHLVQQSPDVKGSDTLHQMAFQQQQLVHHLQMTQRRYVLQHGMNLAAPPPPPQGKLSQTNSGESQSWICTWFTKVPQCLNANRCEVLLR